MRTRLIVSVIILIVGGFAGFVCLNYLIPDYYFDLFPLIPLFFILILTGSYATLSIVKKRKSVIGMKTYMILRATKILLCLGIVFIFVYCGLVEENIISFGIVFMLFYVVSLALESWLFMKISKNR
jgi:hypothetical protein